MPLLKDNVVVEYTPTPRKAGWRVNPWSDEVGCSRSMTYELLAKGAISSVKLGRSRIIITPPAVYLASLAVQAA